MLQTPRTCHAIRHLIAALFFVALAAGLRAQDDDFLFMETAIDTDINTYKSQMMDRGFYYHKSTTGKEDSTVSHLFEGRSASGKNVTVDVQITPMSKTVYGLTIFFNDYTYYRWQEGGVSDEEQRAAFEAVKEELIQYYGESTRRHDFLLSADDSTREAHEHDTFPVMYAWDSNRGTAILALVNLTAEKRNLMLFYMDNKAKAKNDKEKIADL